MKTVVRIIAILLTMTDFNFEARAADPTIFDKVGPDQLAYSAQNMDRSADPRVDFYRYASGGWLQRVERPERKIAISAFDFMIEQTKRDIGRVVAKAAAEAPNATKGSPTRQVGDLYRSYMDVARLDALGAKSLDPYFAEIDAIGSGSDLAKWLGRYPTLTGDVAVAAIVPSADRIDATKKVLYLASGRLVLTQEQVYEDDDASPRIAAYRAFVADSLKLAGWEAAKAEAFAGTALAMERRMQKAKMTPAEAVDPRAAYDPRPLAEVQATVPELDLAALARGIGAEPPEIVVRTEPRYFPELSKLMKDFTLDDFKTYLKLRLILRFMPYLGSAFDAPSSALNKALVGVAILPPREERAIGLMREYLGHPVSRLYVEATFSAETRAKTSDMVERIRAAFLKRMETRTWLTDETRKAAREKLEKLSFKIGHPDRWIDHSSVEIRADDLIGNIVRLSRFSAERDVARIGRPWVPDEFADNSHTLPIIVNAAYDSQKNGFEVPAAFLQAPAYDPTGDAAANFCRVGAVIGHEMTHGFDSGGRLFDARGNLRDWWTDKDAAAFEKEAAKLVEQADAFEVLPGLKARGAQEVKENMADVGGLNFAYDALLAHLKDHPEDDRVVDGLTAKQRCFVSWAQMWTLKATEQSIRNEVMGDGHPPGNYRAQAAPKHVEGFYEAFGIREGDPMWLPKEKRVSAW